MKYNTNKIMFSNSQQGGPGSASYIQTSSLLYNNNYAMLNLLVLLFYLILLFRFIKVNDPKNIIPDQ